MKNLKGVITALVTPFFDGAVDYVSLEKLVRFQLKEGVQGFVINGTTAESPNLTAAERKEIFQQVRRMTGPEFPLIMGTGSNSTAKTIEETKEAAAYGADAVLVVVPYYNKPPQRGLIAHFTAVAEATLLPNILYNVPSRTITSLELDSIVKLSQHPRICGIKEASGNIDFAKQIRQACGKDFLLLSGDDGSYGGFMTAGGDGVISVSSHIIPQAMLKVNASKYQALIDHLFIEANPMPVKKALHLMGLLRSPECRLPLVEMSALHAEKLQSLMKEQGLL